ncbi:MAG: hypothetical protein ABSG03_08550 [Bryobacteraceae bacterium]
MENTIVSSLTGVDDFYPRANWGPTTMFPWMSMNPVLPFLTMRLAARQKNNKRAVAACRVTITRV